MFGIWEKMEIYTVNKQHNTKLHLDILDIETASSGSNDQFIECILKAGICQFNLTLIFYTHVCQAASPAQMKCHVIYRTEYNSHVLLK